MKYIFSFLFSIYSFYLSGQVEIPATNLSCKQYQKNNFTYCLNPENYKTQWTAIILKGSDIEKKVYIPSDSEFFKDIPVSIKDTWEKIEIQTRLWAMEFDSIYVVTGKTIYQVDSTTQTAYYKAIMKGCQGDGLGFWVKPDEKKTNITSYSLSLDMLEEKTSIDFFPTLDKDLQSIFESGFNWEFWPVSVE